MTAFEVPGSRGDVWCGWSHGCRPWTPGPGWYWWADEWGRSDDAVPDDAVGPFTDRRSAERDAAAACGFTLAVDEGSDATP